MACFLLHLQEGDVLWKWNILIPSPLRHLVSEYIWIYRSISKTLGLMACYLLHLQEGDTLWK